MFNTLKHQLLPSRVITNKHHPPISDTSTAPPRAGISCPAFTASLQVSVPALEPGDVTPVQVTGAQIPSRWLSFPRKIPCPLGEIFLPAHVGAGQGEQLLAGNTHQLKKTTTGAGETPSPSDRSQPHRLGCSGEPRSVHSKAMVMDFGLFRGWLGTDPLPALQWHCQLPPKHQC